MAKAKAKAKTKPKATKSKAKTTPKAKAKPNAKAKPKAKSKKTSNKEPTKNELAALAMAGDLEALDEIFDAAYGGDEDDDDGYDAAPELYKWLLVAADLAPTAKQRKAADEGSRDLCESTSLRYDDDQILTGNAHWDVAIAYLTGADGLPRDLSRARSQLAEAKERNYPYVINGAVKILAATRKALDPEALAVFDTVFDKQSATKAKAKPKLVADHDDDGDEYEE